MPVYKRWMLVPLRARQKRTVLLLTVCAIAWGLIRRARARAHARLAAAGAAASAVVVQHAPPPQQLMVRRESSEFSEDVGLAPCIDFALNFLNMSWSCPMPDNSSENGCEMAIREVLLPIEEDMTETHRTWRGGVMDAVMVCCLLVVGTLLPQLEQTSWSILHAAIGVSLTLWAILRCVHSRLLNAQESDTDYAVGLATAEVPSNEACRVWEAARSWARLGGAMGCRRSFERRGSLGIAVEALPARAVSVPVEAFVLQPHNAGQTGRSMRVHAYRVSRPNHSKCEGAGAQAASTLKRFLTDASCTTIRIRQDLPDSALRARAELDLALRRIDDVAAWTDSGECGGVMISSLDVPDSSVPIVRGTADFSRETVMAMGSCGDQPLTATAVFAYACSFLGASLLDPTLERVTVLHHFSSDITLSSHVLRPLQYLDLSKEGSWLMVFRHTQCSDDSTSSRHTMMTAIAPEELLQPHRERLRTLHAGRSFAVSPLLMSALDVQQKGDGSIRISRLLQLDPHLLSSAACRAQAFDDLRVAAGRVRALPEAAHSWFSNVLTLPPDAHRLVLEGPDPGPTLELQDVLLQGRTFRAPRALAVALGTVKHAEG